MGPCTAVTQRLEEHSSPTVLRMRNRGIVALGPASCLRNSTEAQGTSPLADPKHSLSSCRVRSRGREDASHPALPRVRATTSLGFVCSCGQTNRVSVLQLSTGLRLARHLAPNRHVVGSTDCQLHALHEPSPAGSSHERNLRKARDRLHSCLSHRPLGTSALWSCMNRHVRTIQPVQMLSRTHHAEPRRAEGTASLPKGVTGLPKPWTWALHARERSERSECKGV